MWRHAWCLLVLVLISRGGGRKKRVVESPSSLHPSSQHVHQHSNMYAYSTEAAARLGALVYKANVASLAAECAALRSTLETEAKTKEAAEACVVILQEKGEEARIAAEAALGAAREEGEKRLRELYAQAQAHIREKDEGFRRAMAAVGVRCIARLMLCFGGVGGFACSLFFSAATN